MTTQPVGETPPHQRVMQRFVAACQADERIVAATLYGSHARGAADEHSDLDLGLITTDEGHAAFLAERAGFVQRLGEPLFLENFGSASTWFLILAEDVEVELAIGPVSGFEHLHDEPYRVLLDKTNLLAGACFPRHDPDPAGQVETLRRLIYSFWHDFSHFITAFGRGQLWWAQGQLDLLRRMCVNLARLRHHFADPYADAEDYFKLELTLPVEQIASLATTFCTMNEAAMLQAARMILDFYQEVAPPLAQRHGLAYPADLAHMMIVRFNKLSPIE
jgi:predicted nucleotidyltransferase